MNIASLRSGFALALVALVASPAFAGSASSATDQAPKIISAPQPALPKKILGFGQIGSVEVTFTITAEGDVADLKVKSASDALLEESAVNAVRQWKFVPAVKNGQAVAVNARQLFTFEPFLVTPGGRPETPAAAPGAKAMVAKSK